MWDPVTAKMHMGQCLNVLQHAWCVKWTISSGHRQMHSLKGKGIHKHLMSLKGRLIFFFPIEFKNYWSWIIPRYIWSPQMSTCRIYFRNVCKCNVLRNMLSPCLHLMSVFSLSPHSFDIHPKALTVALLALSSRLFQHKATESTHETTTKNVVPSYSNHSYYIWPAFIFFFFKNK